MSINCWQQKQIDWWFKAKGSKIWDISYGVEKLRKYDRLIPEQNNFDQSRINEIQSSNKLEIIITP